MEDPAVGVKEEDLARALLLMVTNNIGTLQGASMVSVVSCFALLVVIYTGLIIAKLSFEQYRASRIPQCQTPQDSKNLLCR
jgi:hypothetical protein